LVRRGIPGAQALCTEACVKISDKELPSSLADLTEAQTAHSATEFKVVRSLKARELREHFCAIESGRSATD
jgi:hypothetical protein